MSASVFEATKKHDWRFCEYAAYFYLWHLFETSQNISDLLDRDLNLIAETQSSGSRTSKLASAALADVIESGLTPSAKE